MVSSVLCQPTKCMSKLLFHFALLCIMYNITFLSHFSDDDDDGYPAEFFAGNLETKIYCINIEEYVTLAIDEVDTNCWSRWIPSDTSQIVENHCNFSFSECSCKWKALRQTEGRNNMPYPQGRK